MMKTSILLIEDNPGDFNLIQLHLKESSVKHDLHHAETLFDGIDIAKNKEIDLVLLDLSLPDSTGFKTLSSFIEKFPVLPIIVLTGINNEIVGNQSVKAGAQDFLVKGQFDGKTLGRSIRYSIQRFKTQIKLESTARNLALSEKRYVEAQEMAKFGNWEMDIVSNKMKWTHEIFRVFGFRANSLSPTLSDYIRYVHLEDKEKVESFFEAATKDGQMHKLEHRIIVDGRNIKYVAIQAKVYYEDTNSKILLVGALQDITERKISEQLIIEKNISNKTSKVKEKAISDIGFHIRTPLSSIVNLLYLLENSSMSSQQKEFLDGLKISVDDLSLMVNNLLNFSVLANEEIKVEEEEFNLKNFLQGIQKVVKIKTENANVKLDFKIDENIPEKIISDNNKLTQVFYNLIENAVQNTKVNGQIEMSINSLPGQGLNENVLAFSIKDQSGEISDERFEELRDAEQILSVYNDQDSESNDTVQFSMAIASKLVNVLSGSLSVERTKTGLCIDIRIPIKTVTKLKFISGEKPTIPTKILLVEDHFLNQIATKKVLTTWTDNVTVDIAENGLIGLEKFREHGYDLILMDLQMPVMNGMESATKIREESSIPIIALTANMSKQEADKCFEIGFNDYLAKPFMPEDLYAKIMQLLVAIAN